MSNMGTIMSRVETRVSTRALLKQLSKRSSTNLKLSGTRLNQREVASYVVVGLQQMWLASESADLSRLQVLLEQAFIEAFLQTGSIYDISKLAVDG